MAINSNVDLSVIRESCSHCHSERNRRILFIMCLLQVPVECVNCAAPWIHPGIKSRSYAIHAPLTPVDITHGTFLC